MLQYWFLFVTRGRGVIVWMLPVSRLFLRQLMVGLKEKKHDSSDGSSETSHLHSRGDGIQNGSSANSAVEYCARRVGTIEEAAPSCSRLSCCVMVS